MPGDARAEAVAAMQWRLRQPFDCEDPAQVATLLDAIPTEVGTRLFAVERGGMESAAWRYHKTWRGKPRYVFAQTRPCSDIDADRLYALTEEADR